MIVQLMLVNISCNHWKRAKHVAVSSVKGYEENLTSNFIQNIILINANMVV